MVEEVRRSVVMSDRLNTIVCGFDPRSPRINACMNTIIQNTEGQLSFRHGNGEISKVFIEIVGMGTKKIRIASLPPEVKGNEIRACMSRHGEVKSNRDEVWTSAHRYKVYNGIRIVEMKLK